MKSGRLDLKELLPLAALALLTVLLCMTKYADYDLWWHLKLGETIYSTHSLPGSTRFRTLPPEGTSPYPASDMPPALMLAGLDRILFFPGSQM